MSVISSQNMAVLFHSRVLESRDKIALRRKRRGRWVSHSWDHVETKVAEIAHALQKENLAKASRVAIFSQTRIEWTLVDWAAMTLGIVVVPIYPSQSPDDLDLILNSVKPEIIFFENKSQLTKLQAISHRITFIKKMISFDDLTSENASQINFDSWVLQTEKNAEDLEMWKVGWRKLAYEIQPTDLMTIIYTSGTTGIPKGVELNHQNFIANLKDCISIGIAEEHDTTLLFLPLSHILGRLEQMLALGVGWRLSYAQNFSTLFEDLREITPSVFFGVPRIFEQMYFKIKNGIIEESLVNRVLLLSFFKSLEKKSSILESGKKPGFIFGLSTKIADRLLFRKIRHKFGDNIRFCICGGAPLSVEVTRFFHLAGLPILEGYGLTESTGPITLNLPKEFKFGSVGRPFPSVNLKVADDGEILIMGDAIMKKYHKDSEESQNAFDGTYYKTGDIGHLDSDGFLFITDRKKDLIISSGAKNISPQKIEAHLKSDSLISQVLIAGDGKDYLVALLAVNPIDGAHLARQNGIQFQSIEDLSKNANFKKIVLRRIETLNQKLAPFEQIRKFSILNRELSAEAGELTPSLKIRRKLCLKKFEKNIEQLYV